jgi:hypothetical protein
MEAHRQDRGNRQAIARRNSPQLFLRRVQKNVREQRPRQHETALRRPPSGRGYATRIVWAAEEPARLVAMAAASSARRSAALLARGTANVNMSVFKPISGKHNPYGRP